MIIKNIGDIIEKNSFKWNGVIYTCGFYKITTNNNTYYLEQFIRYKKGYRAIYKNICSFYAHEIPISWVKIQVEPEEYNNFLQNMKKAARDTKLKRIKGYFKHPEEHYAKLHTKNK